MSHSPEINLRCPGCHNTRVRVIANGPDVLLVHGLGCTHVGMICRHCGSTQFRDGSPGFTTKICRRCDAQIRTDTS